MKRIALERISVRFGRLRALDDVGIELAAGECLALAGPNGSGKSTLIRVLLGLVRPAAGRLLVDGAVRRVDNAVKRDVGYLPESVAFSGNLSGLQVMRFFARARGVPRARAKEVLERVGLAEASRRAVRGYSRGMRQRLGLGVAILAEPQLLILDEPTGGLDQQGLAVLRDVLSEWRERGRMVLAATHDLALMEPRLDRICLLQGGRVIADAPPAELRARAALPVRVSFTLGETEPAVVEGFVERIGRWGRCASLERRNGALYATVAPADLLDLVELQRDHALALRALRVEEPNMDAVYDELVSSGASPAGEQVEA